MWQNAHGWPQLELARAIAAGSSGTSVGRALVVPLQLLLTGPVLAVPFVVGLSCCTAPGRDPGAGSGSGYLAMLAFVVVTGGKPYYLLGFVPVLLAAGVPGCCAWLRRAPLAARWPGVLARQAVIVAVIALPVVRWRGSPRRRSWTSTTTRARPSAGTRSPGPSSAAVGRPSPAERAGLVVLTGNYGEAGALDRALRGAALPPVYSGPQRLRAMGAATGHRRAPVLLVGRHSDAAPSSRVPAARARRQRRTGSTTTSRERRSAGAPRPAPLATALAADPLPRLTPSTSR